MEEKGHRFGKTVFTNVLRGSDLNVGLREVLQTRMEASLLLNERAGQDQGDTARKRRQTVSVLPRDSHDASLRGDEQDESHVESDEDEPNSDTTSDVDDHGVQW